MNRLGKGAQGDAKNQVSKLYAFQFHQKMGFFVPMFHLVIPGVDQILTPGASYEQT